jgi:arylsulfatase A-like enzyme
MINRDALAWLSAQQGQGRPSFVFLNYYDAHAPYQPPAAYRRQFGLSTLPPADQEAILREFHRLGRRQSGPAPGDPRRAEELARAATDLRRDAYDDCIAYLDGQLGGLFDELQRRGGLENTLVIVTADHGEHLGDHQLFGHGHSLYRPLLDVPLLVLYPRGAPAGRRVREPVSLRDVPATVADLLGLGGQSPFPGRSLARCWAPGPAPGPRPAEPLLSEVEHQRKFSPSPHIPASRGPLQSLVAEEKVYIRHADGHEELYDLEGDPAEAHDLAGSADVRPVLERFRAALARLLGE